MTEIPEQPIPAQNMPNPEIFNQSAAIPQKTESKKTFPIILGLIFFLTLAAFGSWYIYSVSMQKNQQEMLMPSVVSLPEKSAPVQASLAPLSSDDSLETLDAEVEDSQIPDFSGEFEQIEKDIQGL